MRGYYRPSQSRRLRYVDPLSLPAGLMVHEIQYLEERVKRLGMRTIFVIAIFASAMAFTGCASSRYRYHYSDSYYDRGSGQQAHSYGFQNGYSDGYRKGQHEGRENDP